MAGKGRPRTHLVARSEILTSSLWSSTTWPCEVRRQACPSSSWEHRPGPCPAPGLASAEQGDREPSRELTSPGRGDQLEPRTEQGFFWKRCAEPAAAGAQRPGAPMSSRATRDRDHSAT